jgi:hypothetical protein
MSEQAFELYKIFLAQSRTEWDFRPLAERALDAAEVFEQAAEARGVLPTTTNQPQTIISPGTTESSSGVP